MPLGACAVGAAGAGAPGPAVRALVGGGTGFVGRALTQLLRSCGREASHVSRQGGQDRIHWEELSQSGLPLCDAVVNLAGEVSPTLSAGVVLGRGGGAISQMAWPFRLGLGGRLGSGFQPLPWIHIRDLAGIVCHVLESESLQGVLSGVSPSSPDTSNGTFAQELAAALGRPALLPVPAWAVRAVFGAEWAVMLLEDQRVMPKHTVESGYHFIFPDLSGALKDIVA